MISRPASARTMATLDHTARYAPFVQISAKASGSSSPVPGKRSFTDILLSQALCGVQGLGGRMFCQVRGGEG